MVFTPRTAAGGTPSRQDQFQRQSSMFGGLSEASDEEEYGATATTAAATAAAARVAAVANAAGLRRLQSHASLGGAAGGLGFGAGVGGGAGGFHPAFLPQTPKPPNNNNAISLTASGNNGGGVSAWNHASSMMATPTAAGTFLHQDPEHQQGLDLCFHKLSFKTGGKGSRGKYILRDASGYALAGRLTAVQGPSGAGKVRFSFFFLPRGIGSET